jgi:hypothetical protein
MISANNRLMHSRRGCLDRTRSVRALTLDRTDRVVNIGRGAFAGREEVKRLMADRVTPIENRLN